METDGLTELKERLVLKHSVENGNTKLYAICYQVQQTRADLVRAVDAQSALLAWRNLDVVDLDYFGDQKQCSPRVVVITPRLGEENHNYTCYQYEDDAPKKSQELIDPEDMELS